MVNGITFASQLITSANMAHYMWTFLNKTNGITKGCAVSASGSNINITTGYFIIYGRMVQIVGTEVVPCPAVTSGSLYCTLVFTIDLTKTNTEAEFNQGYFEILTSTSNYPGVTQQDLDGTGTKYQMKFAQFIRSATATSSFRDLRPILNLNNLYATMKNNLDTIRSQYDTYFTEKKATIEQEIANLQAENYLLLTDARKVQTVLLDKDKWMAVDGSDPVYYAYVVNQTSTGESLSVKAMDNPIVAKAGNAATTNATTVRKQRKSFSKIVRVVTGDGYLEFYTAPGDSKPDTSIYVVIKGV